MSQINRPRHAFIPPELMVPTPLARQPVLMQAPPMTAPRRVQSVPVAPMPPPEPAAASSMPIPPMPRRGGGGGGGGLRDFLRSDAALAMAAGMLEGGDAGESVGRGLRYALAAKQADRPNSNDIKSYQYAKTPEGGGFKGTFVDFMKMGGAGEYGLTPVPYIRDDGSVGYGVTTKSGRFHELDVPGGGIMSPYQKKFDEASGSKAGGARGEALASYQSMKAKLPGLETVVSQLSKLAETATYTYAGQMRDMLRRQTGQEPTEEAIARATFVAMIDNQILPLLRDTFGAQFTEREGQTLRQTLGDPNLSPAEKQAVLEAFIMQKRRDVEALAVEAGIAVDDGSISGGGWTVEEVQ